MSAPAVRAIALDRPLCEQLIATFEANESEWVRGDSRAAIDPGYEAFTACPVPFDVVPIFDRITASVADAFACDVGQATYRMGRYEVGGSQGWHVDFDATHLLGSRRLCSWSLLLSKPEDFDGGELELETSGPLDLAQGEVVGFTARTPHRVLPVTRGRRYVVIAFAGWGAPPA